MVNNSHHFVLSYPYY